MKHYKKLKTKNEKLKTKNHLVVILLGPPGSGKGTQAELLAEKFDFCHVESSEIIEKHLANAKKGDYVIVKGKKYFLLEEKKLRENGRLTSFPLITFWMTSKIKELAKEGKGIAASGWPRSLYEIKEEMPIFERFYGKKNIKVILIELSDREVIWRNTHRKTCELMRHPILYSKETIKLSRCPFDGSKLLIRKDDTPDAIKMRLKEYRKNTLPLIDYFKKQGLKVKKINGEQSVADVFKDILKALK
jgi:adenylate kinase